jgi:hypothetical protein
MDSPSFDMEHVKHVIEAALLTASEPLQLADLNRLFEGELSDEALAEALAEVARSCDGRSIELVNVASGWRFRTRPEYQRFLDRMNPQKSPRYSRAVLETLATLAHELQHPQREHRAAHHHALEVVLPDAEEERVLVGFGHRVVGRVRHQRELAEEVVPCEEVQGEFPALVAHPWASGKVAAARFTFALAWPDVLASA